MSGHNASRSSHGWGTDESFESYRESSTIDSTLDSSLNSVDLNAAEDSEGDTRSGSDGDLDDVDSRHWRQTRSGRLYPKLPVIDSTDLKRRGIHPGRSPKTPRKHSKQDSPAKRGSLPSSFSDTPEKSPKHERKRDLSSGKTAVSNEDNTVINCSIVLVLVLGCAGLFWYTYMYNDEADSLNIMERYAKLIEDMKGKFPSQDRKLWVTLKAACKPVLGAWLHGSTVAQPAIILVASHHAAAETATCISQTVSNALASYSNSTLHQIHISNLSPNPDDMKLDIDNQLRKEFNSGNKVGIIYELEQMPAGASLMLHAYCDNENAPYKDVVLMLHVNLNEAPASPQSWDKHVERFLMKQWERGLGEDEMGAMLSRVANSVIVVKEEDSQIIQNYCS